MPEPGNWGEAAAEIAGQLGIPAGAVMTDEQAAEFRERFTAAMEGEWHPHLMPRQPLTKDEVRQLLRECVTVVKPGEILVLQPGANITPNQLREIHEHVVWWLAENAPGIKVLVVPGEAHQVVRQEPRGPLDFDPGLLPPADPGAGFLP